MITNTRATLEIRSLTHSAAAVTEVLGLQPTLVAEKGDPNASSSHGRAYSSSVWKYDTLLLADPDLADPLDPLAQLVIDLQGKHAALEGLRMHYTTKVWCTGFADGSSGSFVISSELMTALGTLGCDFFCTIELRPEVGAAA